MNMQAKKILFPSDFSACSEEGLSYATSLARDSGAMLLIVHVEEPAETYEAPYYGVSEQRRADRQASLRKITPTDPSVQYQHRYVGGSPASVICELAKDEKVDLIVIPTHGRRGLLHLLMGSVAEAVVRRAPCPVVTIRPTSARAERLPPWPMQLRPLSREEVRDIDRRAIDQLGMPGIVMMENAGRGAAALMEQLGIDGPVTVVAGVGNNGGDGSVIARHLDRHGYSVRVLLVGNASKLQGDAWTNWRIIENSGIPCQELGQTPNLTELASAVRDSAWTVDALLGTGTKGEIREPFASVIDCLNQSSRNLFAVDLPSGLDCDTGKPLGPCIKAQHTATFVGRKKGLDAAGAAEFTGHVHIIDIGAPRTLLEPYRVETDGLHRKPSV